MTWIITGNAMKQFFKKMEAAKEIYKYRSIAEILTLLISMFSSKCMVNFIKNSCEIICTMWIHMEFCPAAFYIVTS